MDVGLPPGECLGNSTGLVPVAFKNGDVSICGGVDAAYHGNLGVPDVSRSCAA
jgi:hypothetical protein